MSWSNWIPLAVCVLLWTVCLWALIRERRQTEQDKRDQIDRIAEGLKQGKLWL